MGHARKGRAVVVTDPETTSLLAQAQERARTQGAAEVTASYDQASRSVAVETSVGVEGQKGRVTWLAKAWAKWTGKPGKDDASAGVTGKVTW